MKLSLQFSYLAIIFVAGCSLIKANPAPDAGFIEKPERLAEHRERYPFNRVWISKTFALEKERFDKMIIRPVNLEYLKRTGDWKHLRTLSDAQVREDAHDIGEYLNKTLRDAFLGELNKRIAIVERGILNTLVLEIAIVELIPTDVVRNVAGHVAGFFVPGGGLVSAGAGGSIAVEARLRDAQTKEVVAMFKDREQAKIRPVDLGGLTHYEHARESIEDWATQAVILLNTPITEKVDDSSPIQLSPW